MRALLARMDGDRIVVWCAAIALSAFLIFVIIERSQRAKLIGNAVQMQSRLDGIGVMCGPTASDGYAECIVFVRKESDFVGCFPSCRPTGTDAQPEAGGDIAWSSVAMLRCNHEGCGFK